MRTVTGVLAAGVLTASVVWAAGDKTAGEKSYVDECKDCHQMNGAPVPSVFKKMQAQNVTMRDLKAPEVQNKADAEWKKAITEGIGKMKAVKELAPADVDNVIAFMRTLKDLKKK